jgi:flagellar assembly protein FliH
MSESVRIIEGANAFTRWQAPEVGARVTREEPPQEDGLAGDSEETLPELVPPTAEELEAIRLDARQEGYAEGREEGFEAGMREGRAQVEERIRRLDGILARLDQPLRQLDAEVEEQLTRLALIIAGQLVRRELEQDSSRVLEVVREALSLLPANAREVRVRVHPDDASLLREHLDEPAWRIEEDPSITPGGCVVHSAQSRIDATLERELAAVSERLFGADGGTAGAGDGAAE